MSGVTVFGTNISIEEIQRMGKKNFFPNPDRRTSEATSEREIVRAEKGLVERIHELGDDECLVIPRILAEHTPARMFWKYAKEIELPRRTEHQLRRLKPVDLIREAFEKLEPGFYVSLAFDSYERGFSRVRTRIPLVSMLDGDRLATYSEMSPFTSITIDNYAQSGNPSANGGKFVVEVPSRTPHNRRYKITLEGVPVRECRRNHTIWSNMSTVHACPIKVHDLSYRHRCKLELDEHEVAAYIAVAYDLAADGDTSALDYSPFMHPTQDTVDFNRTMETQVLLEYRDEKRKLHKRYLNTAERELLLVNLVQQKGLDHVFGPLGKDRELREYTHIEKVA